MQKKILTFKNNSVSGRDYRATGVHIEIPAYTEVVVSVAAEIAEKIVADIRRKSPAIHVSISDPETVDEAELDVDEAELNVDIANPVDKTPTRRRGGRKPKRKSSKMQKLSTIQEPIDDIVHNVPNSSEVDVHEMIE
jgi:hypothetical protein